MTTVEKEFNCHVANQTPVIESEVDKEALCRKMCVNILEGLLEGYEGLLEKNPDTNSEIQSKVQEIREQLQKNHIKQELDGIFKNTIR